VSLPGGNGSHRTHRQKGQRHALDKDEHVRPDVTLEAMAKLPPVFSKTGSITAGNSSGITMARRRWCW